MLCTRKQLQIDELHLGRGDLPQGGIQFCMSAHTDVYWQHSDPSARLDSAEELFNSGTSWRLAGPSHVLKDVGRVWVHQRNYRIGVSLSLV